MAFTAVAEVYELLSPPTSRLEKERPFLYAWAGECKALLELACGPGTHAHALATQGVTGRRVTAVDLSPAMIERAQSLYRAPGLEFVIGDLRMPPQGPWDRVCILGNSLNLLPDEAGVEQALSAIQRTLAPGGSLLLQNLNPEQPQARLPKQLVKTATRDGVDIVVVKSLVPHGGRRTLTLSTFQAGPGGTWHQAAETAVLLDLSCEVLARLLKVAGFGKLEWWGGMDGSPFQAESSGDLVVVARA